MAEYLPSEGSSRSRVDLAVGNGASIAIWHDKWLPTLHPSKIRSPVSVLPHDAKVAALIDHSTGWWNHALIESIFSQSEAESICGIPLSLGRQQDRLVWAASKQGTFSVRSAYYLEKSRREQEQGESLNQGDAKNLWKLVWSLKVPSMLKNFMWKVGMNLLPTKDNLFRQHIAQDPLCPICNLEPESVEHILWSCRSSQAVWQESTRRAQKLSIQAVDGLALMQGLLRKLDASEFVQVMVMARLIWLRRNSFIFEGRFSPPATLIIQASESLEGFTQANALPEASARSSQHAHHRWSRPAVGLLKCNWDRCIAGQEK